MPFASLKIEIYIYQNALGYIAYKHIAMDAPGTIARAYSRRRCRRYRPKRWTQEELQNLCKIWWVHSYHVGEKGVIYHFREECREKGIQSNRTYGAILSKVADCFNLYNKIPTRCSRLLRSVFEKIRRELKEA